MSVNRNAMGVWAILFLGCGIWVGGALTLKKKGRLSYDVNIATLKGSPYGKVLALAMQGPIGLYFHKGESHETSRALGKPHVHADGSICHEDHDHHEEADHPTEHDESLKGKESPLHLRAKDQIKKMTAYAHRKTDGRPLTAAHEKFLQSENEDMLKLAYELDPSNYTNYNNYHLFLSVNDFGKHNMNQEAALALAQHTLDYCKRDDVDPASWLTAASAAYNVITYIGWHLEKFTKEQILESLSEFDQCMEQYDKLLEESQKKGFQIPNARLEEMKERARFLKKLRKAQGVYLKRKMSNR